MSDISPEQDLDLSFLYEIADGSNEFIVESIGMFLEQTPHLLTTITAAFADSDWPTAAQAAHKLKPTLGFFGMPVSQSIMQEIELACKAGEPIPAEIFKKFNQVEASISANLIALKKIKEEKEAGL